VGYWAAAQLAPNRISLALSCLQIAGYEVYAPRLRQYRISHGRKIERRPSLLFPSYIFCAIVTTWREARWCPGVIRLVMDGAEQPAKVPARVIDELRARERGGLIELPTPPRLQRGDRVRVIRGPFEGHLALYAGQAPHERVMVLLALLGSQQRAELAARDVAPVA
jgi:transcriptional antiterminator RfaH